MWDSGYLASDVVTVNITVESVNDEPPRLASTRLTSLHTERGGPTPLLDSTATLYDDDNCPEHRLIAQVQLVLNGFVDSEDVLLDGAGQGITLHDSQFDFGSGSAVGPGFGEWLTEPSQPLYVTLTCDQTDSPDCYNSLLRALHYNNTADEPTASDRSIVLQVS